MSRRPGPLDQGQTISTQELLSAVEEHGPHWPVALSHYTIEAVSTAVGREIVAGNLYDGRTLTPQGAQLLATSRMQAAAGEPHLELRLRDGGSWELGCTTCGTVFGGGTARADDPAVDAVVAISLRHGCGTASINGG